MNLKAFGRKRPWSICSILPPLPWGTEERNEDQGSCCPDWDLNQSPPEYEP
jgi:hypothetical protein